MKQTFLSLLIMLCSISTWAQKPIKMQIINENKPAPTKYYIQVGEEDKYGSYKPEEVIEAQNGKFYYSTNISKIVPAKLKQESGENAHATTFYLVPGENLIFTLKGEEHFYGGSKIYEECNKADEAITPYLKEVNEYYDNFMENVGNLPEGEKEKATKAFQDTLTMKYNAFEKAAKEYGKANSNSEGAFLFLGNHVYADSVYTLAGDMVKNGRVGEYLRARMAYIKEQRELSEKRNKEREERIASMNGTPAKDFTLNDINGNPLSLSSLQGKYVVLDFWGSWCGWCIKGFPDMKKYYTKYSDKLQILGIDCNDTEQQWKDAVKKYELPWLHVYNTRTSSVVEDYNITGYPTKIVIDPKGNVIKVVIGEDPAFYTYLDELFSK